MTYGIICHLAGAAKMIGAHTGSPMTPASLSEIKEPTHRRPRTRWLWLAGIVLLGAGAYLFWSRNSSAQVAQSGAKSSLDQRGSTAVIPVVATRVHRGNIGVYFSGLGAVTPIYTVTVKARVDGELINVLDHEGDIVQKGDLLMEVDPRPYQAQLEQYEGQLVRDQAVLDNAKVDLARYQGLLKQNAIPEQQVATQQAIVAQSEGVVKSDQGQINSVKLNLTYCKITAPITGRVGLRLVDPGNIVHAADANGLVIITQVQPISVIFTISEDQLPTVREKMRAGKILQVDAYDHDLQMKLAQGTLTTFDNEIDQTTGTVRLRATFDNKDDTLFPNQFVNIRLLVQQKQGVVLLNSAGIQRSGANTYVLLVKPDSTVTLRNVTAGTTEGDQTEITSGLQAGDTVVTTGVDKLLEGSLVKAQISGDPSPAKAAGKPGSGKS
jgi:multidrug efflux system membrane fusion protein